MATQTNNAPKAQRDNLSTTEREAVNTNEATLNNAPEVQDYGKQAAASWFQGDNANDKGDQLAIMALFHAFHKVTLNALVTNRKGEVEEVIKFDLADLATEPKNESGGRDNKVIGARTNAIAKYVFGIEADDVDQAFKNRLARAMQVVFYFVQMGYALDQVSLIDKKVKRRGKTVTTKVLKLPFTAVNDAPQADESGSIDEEELDTWNRLRDGFVSLDGTKGRTVAELQRRANPPKPRGQGANTTQPVDKSANFVGAVNVFLATLHEMTDDNAESDIALTKGLRKAMWEAHALLTKLFDAEPLDAEEAAEFNKPAKQARK